MSAASFRDVTIVVMVLATCFLCGLIVLAIAWQAVGLALRLAHQLLRIAFRFTLFVLAGVATVLVAPFALLRTRLRTSY
jgi:hypothetical protein